MRWVNGLFVLLVNAVPLYGVMVLGWSIGTVLLLYWLENLLVALFTSARIVLYRWLTHAAVGSLLREYAGIAFPFTLVHGVFVAFIVFVTLSGKPQWHVSFDQFRYGALQMLVVLGVDFLADALRMRSRSSDWIVDYAHRRLGRIAVMHLGILFGIWGMAASASPIGVLYAIIGLKTLSDLSVSLGTAHSPGRTVSPPPAWVAGLVTRLARDEDKGDVQDAVAAWQHAAEGSASARRNEGDEGGR